MYNGDKALELSVGTVEKKSDLQREIKACGKNSEKVINPRWIILINKNNK